MNARACPGFNLGEGGAAHISFEEEGKTDIISYKIKQKTNENCFY